MKKTLKEKAAASIKASGFATKDDVYAAMGGDIKALRDPLVVEILAQVEHEQPPIMDEDTFMDKFEPRNSPEGSLLWERDQVLPLLDAGEIDDNNVWTAVDTDGGIAYVAGWHAVNVFAYVVTKVKWVNPLETVEMDDEESEDW